MKNVKFLVPVYGIKRVNAEALQLEATVMLRGVKILENEHKIFSDLGLRPNFNAVLEIDYSFDEEDSSEPYPGISIRLLNMIDASFVVYDEGRAGLAAIIPAEDSGHVPLTLSSANPQYAEYLEHNIKEEFVTYYNKFKVAYNMRPMAFDMFRRSQERFNNNDRTIDSCTVLESILVPKGERSKRSFIVNGLKIMGYGEDEADRIGKLVEYRNAIIHADREKLNSLYRGTLYTLGWFEETFKLVRKILYRYVEKPWD